MKDYYEIDKQGFLHKGTIYRGDNIHGLCIITTEDPYKIDLIEIACKRKPIKLNNYFENVSYKKG
jgi:hypothetical protein